MQCSEIYITVIGFCVHRTPFSVPDSKVHGIAWGPSGADKPQVGSMLAPLTLLSGVFRLRSSTQTCPVGQHPEINYMYELITNNTHHFIHQVALQKLTCLVGLTKLTRINRKIVASLLFTYYPIAEGIGRLWTILSRVLISLEHLKYSLIDFSKSITALGICIDENLTFDNHVNNICLKASRQIGALQRLTGLLDLPSRRAIYTSFIVSNFNYCPLVWFFTSRASIMKMQKLQERALRFLLKDSISDYETLSSKGGVDSFRISSLKNMAVEIYKILNGMDPKYLSALFSKASTPYNLGDDNKLIQPLKRTTTYGIKSLAYYGT